MQQRLLLVVAAAVAAVVAQDNCSHVDATGCRALNDLVGEEQPLLNMTKDMQIAKCASLCCANAQCDAWAVREMYAASWAKNCQNAKLPKGSDCCLLKKKGWHMQSSLPGCTSGGRSAAPQPPAKPTPVRTSFCVAHNV